VSGDAFFGPAENTASRLVAGEVVIVRVPDGDMAVLNESGGAVWCAADGTRRAGEVAEVLAARYGPAARPDAEAFLRELVSLGLVVRLPGPLDSPAKVPPLPEPTAYRPPAVRVHEKLETLAGICGSTFGTYTNCQLESCLDPYD